MELDVNLTNIFADLQCSLIRENVETIDFLLRVNFGHRWPKLEPLSAKSVLLKMMEMGIWKVDLMVKECRLSELAKLLEKSERMDLSAAVKDFGQYPSLVNAVICLSVSLLNLKCCARLCISDEQTFQPSAT